MGYSVRFFTYLFPMYLRVASYLSTVVYSFEFAYIGSTVVSGVSFY